MKRILTALTLALLAGWPASGLMVLDPGEVAVITRVGAVNRTASAGLRYRLPWPIETEERVAIGEVRRVEPARRRLITGDTNLVELDLAVQYTVSDPVAFVTAMSDPESVVSQVVTATAAEVVSTLEVDLLMTTGRATLQQAIRAQAQAALDRLEVGVAIAAVDVRELSPPAPVVDAFNDVSSARGDKETLALAADAYASQVIPDARGEAARQIEGARGDASHRLAAAQGQIARFEALRAAPRAATRVQLRHDMLQAVGPRLEVIGARPGAEVRLDERP